MTRKWSPVLYPALFGAYPIVRLYAQNAAEVRPYELVVPMAMVCAAAVGLWGLLRLALRDAHRAGLVASLVLIYFFTTAAATPAADRALEWLSTIWVRREIRLPRWSVLTPLTVLFLGVGYQGLKRLKDAKRLTPALNAFAAVLVALPSWQAFQVRSAVRPDRRFPTLATLEQTDRRPDIYYIILDGFARGDILRDTFGYDLDPLLAHLESRGFYVARRAVTNYCQTPLSLGSSLNGDYHRDGSARGGVPEQAVDPSLFSDNAVVRSLRPLGYRFITFASGFDFTDGPVSDLHLSPYRYVTAFHRMLLEDSPLAFLLPNPMEWDSYTMTRERTNFLFDKLPEIARRPGPTFTVAHVLSPHPPFVFGADGEDVSPHEKPYFLNDGNVYTSYYGNESTYVAGYREQAAYLAGRVGRAIDAILDNSPEPPIIILQSDHGSGLRLNTGSGEATDVRERMSILNAYYLPGGRREGLHQGISPVNAFRVVFNNEFGARLPLLPDESYFSVWGLPFLFERVTDRVLADPEENRNSIADRQAAPDAGVARDRPADGPAPSSR